MSDKIEEARRPLFLLLTLDEHYDMEWFDNLETAAYQLKGVADVEVLAHHPPEDGEESGVVTWRSTARGFSLGEFEDEYKQQCSIQDSSRAGIDCFWLGVGNTGPRIEGPFGTKGEDIMGRMHLTKEHARDLITILQRFVETGSVHP